MIFRPIEFIFFLIVTNQIQQMSIEFVLINISEKFKKWHDPWTIIWIKLQMTLGSDLQMTLIFG